MKILIFKYDILKYSLESIGNCFLIDINACDLMYWVTVTKWERIKLVLFLLSYYSDASKLRVFNFNI